VVRAHVAAKACGLKLIIGAELRLADGTQLVLLATDRRSYGTLSALIAAGRRRGKKGTYRLERTDIEGCAASGLLALLVAGDGRWLAAQFPGRAWIAAELHCGPNDRVRLEALREQSRSSGLPLVAAGDVHMHLRSRRRLQDALTAIRLGTPLERCGRALYPNAERHLRARVRLAQIYPPELLAESAAIAERCAFSLEELRYEYPEELVPPGETPASWLAQLTSRARKASCVRAAARQPTPRCATRSASRKWTRHAWRRCSSASCRRRGTSHPTSTSISSTSGARR
jgi:error-prone DNA polymerase